MRKIGVKNTSFGFVGALCPSINFIPHLYGENIGGNVRRFTAKETKCKPVKTCTFVVLYLLILCLECLLPDNQ